MGAEPRVRVAVVTSNNAGVIPGLLAGLPAACTGVTWELVVADNNSADGTLAAVAASGFHGTVVRMSRNAGYAAGINAAAAVPGQSGGGQQTAGGSAAFDALMVMGPNVRLDRGAVARLWRSLKQQPPAGIAVPRLDDAEGRTVPTLGRRPTVMRALGDALLGSGLAGRSGLGEVITARRAYQSERTVDWAAGSAMLISARCLDDIGPLDESFLLYTEATELALRAGDAGWRTVFNPEARGRVLGTGPVAAARLRSLRAVNRVRLYTRRAGPVRAGAYMSAVILGEGLRTLVRRDGSRDALAALLLPARRVRELDELPRPLEFELVPAAGDDAAAALDELPAEPDTFERTPPPAPTAHLRPPGLISDDRLDFGDDAVDDLGDRAGDDAPASQEVSW